MSFCSLKNEIYEGGETISLGAKDSKLLEYFLNNDKRLITSEELTQNVWGYDSLPSDATLRSHIRTIRDIIGKERILTVRGEGYIYE